MAKDLYYGKIDNDDVDWAVGDESTDNKVCSGTSVQEYIKDGHKAAMLGKNSRGGFVYFDPDHYLLYLFKDTAHYEEWEANPDDVTPLSVADFSSLLAGRIDNILIASLMPQGSTQLNYTTSEETMPVNFSLTSRSKGLGDPDWQINTEQVNYVVSIDKGMTGNYRQVGQGTVMSGGSVYFDIVDFVSGAGTYLVKIDASTNSITNKTATSVFTVNLTSMAIRTNTLNWYTPMFESNLPDFYFGGLEIRGSIVKTLHLKVTSANGTDYQKEYTTNLGTAIYTTNLLNYTPNPNDPSSKGWEFPTINGVATSGVYHFDCWLTAGNVSSQHVEYNIMCVSAADEASVRLICFNNYAEKAINYAANNLLHFAFYNGTSDRGDIQLVLTASYGGGQGQIGTYDFNNILAATDQVFSVALNIDTDAEDGSVTAAAQYGNTQSKTFALDNSASYPAITEGLYFYLNPANRTNSDRPRVFVNERMVLGESLAEYGFGALVDSEIVHDDTEIIMSFVDHVDGWTVDDEGRKCFIVPAHPSTTSRLTIGYGDQVFTPLANYSQRLPKTVEFVFKSANVANYDEPIITIADESGNDWTGIKVYPNKVMVRNNTNKNDAIQSMTFGDEQTIHLAITISPNYNSFGNLCIVYINGAKNLEFEYTESPFGSGCVALGAQHSDLYLYSMRVYNRAFTFPEAITNFIASLYTLAQRQAADAAARADWVEDWVIDYQKAYENKNVMVIEMAEGWTLPAPRNGWNENSDAGLSTIEFHYHDDHSKDFKIEDVETNGQGTTSMGYYAWNLRFRIDKWPDGVPVPAGYQESGKYNKKRPVSYWNPTLNTWNQPSDQKTVRFDGDAHTPIKRITGKKNYASSMQSHKMGTTAAFNDIHHGLGLDNEVGGNVAVFQEPFYGFERNSDGSYTFIGLYTVGPDKGDKPTFGYDNEDYEDSLITLEGTDHTPVMATFSYPWKYNSSTSDAKLDPLCNVYYDGAKECLGAKRMGDIFDEGWEAANCKGLSTDDDTPSVQDGVLAALVGEWKPAYDVAYNNSTFILPIPEGYTIASMNANPTAFQSQRDPVTHRPYSQFEFWDSSYKLYYYNVLSGQYEQNGVNLLTGSDFTELSSVPTGTTSYEYCLVSGILYKRVSQTESGSTWETVEGNDNFNEAFKTARRDRFKANMANYWNLNDCLFHYSFREIFAATDNDAKNSYPYKFRLLANGGRWQWRQDDLDSIFDIENNGRPQKSYSVEAKDMSDVATATPVFKGEDSRFWTLIGECFQSQLRTMGYNILDQMVRLSGKTTGTTLERLMGFFEKYYWNKAQNYFSRTAYGNDAEYAYEASWMARFWGNNVNPLTQSLGDHYTAERLWVERRMVYCMSKFHYGPFGTSSDVSLGQISMRTQQPVSFSLKPAIDLYPVAFLGQAPYNSQVRVLANESDTYDVSVGGSNTVVAINGADYLTDIGDMAGLVTDPDSPTAFSVASKRLQRIKLGDEDPSLTVNNNITELSLGNNPSLVEIDARNLPKLAGTVDLSKCPRIMSALFEGSKITALTFDTTVQGEYKKGATKLVHLSVPKTLLELRLVDMTYLTDLTFEADSDPDVVYIDNCDGLAEFYI